MLKQRHVIVVCEIHDQRAHLPNEWCMELWLWFHIGENRNHCRNNEAPALLLNY